MGGTTLKLSFSIQNWTHMTFDELCMAALDARLKGLELCDIQSELFRGKSSPANPALAAAEATPAPAAKSQTAAKSKQEDTI